LPAELSDRVDVFVAMTKFEAVRLMQATDKNIRNIVKMYTGTRGRTDGMTEDTDGYQLVEGVLYKIIKDRPLLVIPKAMRKGIVIAAHDYAGHFSVDRTVARILADYWFSGMRRYVKQHIAMCVDCLVVTLTLTFKLARGRSSGQEGRLLALSSGNTGERRQTTRPYMLGMRCSVVRYPRCATLATDVRSPMTAVIHIKPICFYLNKCAKSYNNPLLFSNPDLSYH